ncbi:hypothetical protein KDW_02410 [Dictyobacter vulcani]|uniref:Uncharacterized protein n=2 Tax=Dictyobacter vulcani TaxID=2607529 RepID=A0A5J4KIP4_9CHLR|nr:hypothetical protein KDW_02410 [Dictyobacter vulcani]
MLNRAQNFQRMVPVGSHVKIFLKSGHILAGKLLQIAIDHIILENVTGGNIAAYFDAIDVWETLNDSKNIVNVEDPGSSTYDLQQNLSIQKPEQKLTLLPKQEQTLDSGQLESKKMPVHEQIMEASSIPTTQDAFGFKQENLEYDQRVPEIDKIEPGEQEQTDIHNRAVTEQILSSHLTQVDKAKEEIWQQLRELEEGIREKIQKVNLEIKPPNFILPQEISATHKGYTLWNRIRDRYNYANQLNELGPYSEKIHLLIEDARDLKKIHPSSLGVKRHLAYFYWLAEKPRQALKTYREAAMAVQEVEDFYNVSVLSYKVGDIVSAYTMLEELFHISSIYDNSELWYIFILLLQKSHNYQPLLKLWERADLETKERVLILQTLIYLLLTNKKLHEAYEFYNLMLNGTPTQAAIKEVFDQIMDDREDAFYQKENSQIEEHKQEKNEIKPVKITQPEIEPKGWVHFYKEDKGYGFVRTPKHASLSSTLCMSFHLVRKSLPKFNRKTI